MGHHPLRMLRMHGLPAAATSIVGSQRWLLPPHGRVDYGPTVKTLETIMSAIENNQYCGADIEVRRRRNYIGGGHVRSWCR